MMTIHRRRRVRLVPQSYFSATFDVKELDFLILRPHRNKILVYVEA